MAEKMKGFGTVNLGFGTKPIKECLTQVGDGKIVTNKPIREVGGNKGGETGGGAAEKGPAKMDSVPNKGKGISTAGHGPALMPKGNGTTELKSVGGRSTTKLGGLKVREQP